MNPTTYLGRSENLPFNTEIKKNKPSLTLEEAKTQAEEALWIYPENKMDVESGGGNIVYFVKQEKSDLIFNIRCNLSGEFNCNVGQIFYNDRQMTWEIQFVCPLSDSPRLFDSLDHAMENLCKYYRAKPFTSPLTTFSLSYCTEHLENLIMKDEPVGTYIFVRYPDSSKTTSHRQSMLIKNHEGMIKKIGPAQFTGETNRLKQFVLPDAEHQEIFEKLKNEPGFHRYKKALDFTRLSFIPDEQRKKYTHLIEEETKKSIKFLVSSGKFDLSLVNLLLEFAQSCPALRWVEIYQSNPSSFEKLDGKSCTTEGLNQLEQNVKALKSQFVLDQYCRILKSFLFCLFERLEKQQIFKSKLKTRASAEFFQGPFSDFTLVVGDKKIQAHRFLLGMRAPNLGTMNPKFSEAQQKEITITEFSYEAVGKTVECLYKGNIALTFEETVEVCQIAHRWGDEELHRHCESLILRHLKPSPYINVYGKISKKLCVILKENICKILSTKIKIQLLANIGPFLNEICNHYTNQEDLLERLLEVFTDLLREKVEFEENKKADIFRQTTTFLKI